MKIISKIILSLSLVLLILLLVGVVKGDKGSPIFFQKEGERDARVGGPFESTNNTSRFLLTESIVEDGTVFFNEQRARAASPDLVKVGDKYISIFTPGVSFLGIPFYALGKLFGTPQLFTYFLTMVLALFNLYLIVLLSTRMGLPQYLGLIGGVTFLLATNALSYSATLTQHHASTFFILLCLHNALGKRSLFHNLLFGFWYATSLTVDLPNAFILLPVLIYVIYQNFSFFQLSEKFKISLKISLIGIFVGMLPVIFLIAFYNKTTTGSPTSFAQMIGRYDYPDPTNYKKQLTDKQPEEKNGQKSQEFELLSTPFETRFQASGFYILMMSDERSWLYYSPVILLGFVGIIIALRTPILQKIALLSLSLVVMNILIYTMWGDPWGGWSFGPRYLIPAAAILSIFVPALLDKWRNPLLAFLIVLLFAYSSYLSFLGGLTTNDIPPKQEAVNLTEPIPWTYEYNKTFIEKNQSSSLFYNLFLKGNLDLKTYHYLLTASAVFVFLLLYLNEYLINQKHGK